MATIKVHARIHPCSCPTSLVAIEGDRLLASKNVGSSQRNSTEIGFTFDSIFKGNATQAEVFDKAAKDVVEKFISGYNGTIFAYGQTGTGKTYTVEGEDLSKDVSPRHGLIPQTLSFIFKEIENLKDECATVQISFIELYNETAFDLLGPLMYGTNNKRDLPKVLVSLGTSGSCSMHGLSVHNIRSEYEARKLHLRGRCNRAVAFTASNEQSSRSHVIFTILLTRQGHDSEVVLRSKLNLVDLAGSERVDKNKRDGLTSLNTETKHINLSLHYLEIAILSLQKLHLLDSRSSEGLHSSRRENLGIRSKRCQSAHLPPLHIREKLSNSASSSSWNSLKCHSAIGFSDMKRRGHSMSNSTSLHVSYRNSLLTMLLQDSLGGNCNTAMIATLSLEPVNFNETISTCRFAQRVARVTNSPVINKGVNEEILIKKLQNKITKLTKELMALKQNSADKNENYLPISSVEKAKVIDVVNGYLDGKIGDPLEKGIDGPHKVRACLGYLKDLVIKNTKFTSEPNSSDERDSGVGMCSSMPTNNSENEPCSPTLTAGSGDSNEGTLTITSQPNAPSQVIGPPSTERNSTPSSSQHFFASPSNTTEQTGLPQKSERHISRSAVSGQQYYPFATNESLSPTRGSSAKCSNCVYVGDTEKLLLWELELQKQTLIQKSKLLSTALSNQKARILVLEKHGCPPDEIDNERLAEQQLRRKQAEVEQRLSVIIKRILETKSAKNSGSHQESAAFDIKKGVSENKPSEEALESHKLALQERSTRLQLLSFREKLVPGLLSSFGKLQLSDPTPKQEEREFATDDGSTVSCDNTMSSPDISSPESLNFENHIQKNHPKQTKKTSKMESPYETKIVPKCQARTYSATRLRRGTLPDIKKKSRVSILDTKSLPRRQSKKSQVGPLNQGSVRSSISARRGISSPVFGRQSSNLLPSRNKQMSSPGNYGQHPSAASSSLEGKVSQEREGENLMKSVGCHVSSMIDKMAVPRVRRDAPSTSTRRQAVCSNILLSHRHSSKQTPRPQQSLGRYDFEPNNGFILRTNDEVYKASSFTNDELTVSSLPYVSQQTTPNSSTAKYNWTRNPCPGEYSEGVQNTHKSSPGRYSEDVQDTHNSSSGVYSEKVERTQNYSNGEYSVRAQGQQIELSFLGAIVEKSPKIVITEETENFQAQASNRPGNVKGPKTEVSPEAGVNVPPTEPIVSPMVVKARKQQIERAKRIREVTNAVEVIQAAYRRYVKRRKK